MRRNILEQVSDETVLDEARKRLTASLVDYRAACAGYADILRECFFDRFTTYGNGERVTIKWSDGARSYVFEDLVSFSGHSYMGPLVRMTLRGFTSKGRLRKTVEYYEIRDMDDMKVVVIG